MGFAGGDGSSLTWRARSGLLMFRITGILSLPRIKLSFMNDTHHRWALRLFMGESTCSS